MAHQKRAEDIEAGDVIRVASKTWEEASSVEHNYELGTVVIEAETLVLVLPAGDLIDVRSAGEARRLARRRQAARARDEVRRSLGLVKTPYGWE